jgi:hypothetical protein
VKTRYDPRGINVESLRHDTCEVEIHAIITWTEHTRGHFQNEIMKANGQSVEWVWLCIETIGAHHRDPVRSLKLDVSI